LKWLMSKISATIGCSAATTMRACCALAWREASMKQRSPRWRRIPGREVEHDAAALRRRPDVPHEVAA
jgi:hypothetical protein